MTRQITYQNIFGETVVVPVMKKSKKHGYAAPPGTGPEGKTCKSCKFLFRNQMSKTYLKCLKFRELGGKWTGGVGTDVLARSPACKYWEKADAEI